MKQEILRSAQNDKSGGCSCSGPIRLVLLLLVCLLLLGACAMPGDAAPVVKIGLIAPFEGLGRPLGYAVLPQVKAAIAEANASGALGPYRVALVALNDDLDPATAEDQSRALAQDRDVLAVLGPFTQATADAAAPVLAAAGIPALVPAPLSAPTSTIRSLCPPPDAIAAALDRAEGELADVFFPGDAAAAADALTRHRLAGWNGILVGGPDLLRTWFIARARGAAEGTRAVGCALAGAHEGAQDRMPEGALARGGAAMLLDALAADLRAHDRPTRAGVAAALADQPLAPSLAWYAVENGAWAAAR